MNQKQYIRLSIVLAAPALIASFWLAQQDFVFNKGQIVTCSMDSDYCYHEQMPLNKAETYTEDYAITGIKYKTFYPETFLIVYDFNFPVKIYFDSLYSNEEIDVTSLINGKMLEEKPCMLSETTLRCEEGLFSFTSSFGRIEFVYPDDEVKYRSRILEAKSYFEDYFLIRIAIGFGLFLSIAASYLISSWLIHFIIYGARIGSKKKRPYQ